MRLLEALTIMGPTSRIFSRIAHHFLILCITIQTNSIYFVPPGILCHQDISNFQFSTVDTQSNHAASLGSSGSQCCACDEAKYELIFEGLWSKYTHPNEFPENQELAHFGDIIGASHSSEFRMWDENTYASEGVKELAELGSTKKLEAELKQESSKTRTIIKARELRYPTLNSKTSAVFRTDRHHHLVSILSKLGPSPDWMTGVSALELCQQDCTWVSQKTVNLRIFDAGVDSGTTFTALDLPSRPPERIHVLRSLAHPLQLTTNNASSSAYQFANPQGSLGHGEDQTKPFARLTIIRQRIYERSCDGDQSRGQVSDNFTAVHLDQIDSTYKAPNIDCRFTDWSEWSNCSSTCGKGMRSRTRNFINDQALSSGCLAGDLIEKEICLSECIGNVECLTRDWSPWSKCSASCGQGFRQRTRIPLGFLRRECASIELTETEACTGDCKPEETPCPVTEWSQWSDCSAVCGAGVKIRTRKLIKSKDSTGNCTLAKLYERQSCSGKQSLCKQIPPSDTMDLCTKPADSGPCKGHLERWYYDRIRGMCKKFLYGGCLAKAKASSKKPAQPSHNPNLPIVNCILSEWSPWSTCSSLCGKGERVQSRHVIQMPQNGGKPCDKRSRKQKCVGLPPCPPKNMSSN